MQKCGFQPLKRAHKQTHTLLHTLTDFRFSLNLALTLCLHTGQRLDDTKCKIYRCSTTSQVLFSLLFRMILVWFSLSPLRSTCFISYFFLIRSPFRCVHSLKFRFHNTDILQSRELSVSNMAEKKNCA